MGGFYLFRNKFLKNSTISILGSLFAGASNYLFHFLVSRKIAVSEYGELQALLALVSVLGILAATFSNYTIKEISGLRAEGKTVELAGFASSLRAQTYTIALWLLLGLALLSPFIVHALHLRGYWGLLTVIAAASLGIVASVYTGIITGFQNFHQVNIVGSLGALIKLAAAIVLAWYFPTASVIAVSFLLAALVMLVIVRKFAVQYIPRLKIFPPWGKVQEKFFIMMGPVFLFSLLLVFIGNIDVLFVKHVYGSQMAGFYGAFETLANISFFVSGAILAVLLPQASSEGRLGKPLNSQVLRLTYGSIVLIGLVAVAACKFFPSLLITVLFGHKYLLYAQYLWLFATASGMQSLLLIEANIAYARHDYAISYILLVVILGMVSAVYFGHGSMRAIPLGVIATLIIGWLIALLRHLGVRRKYRLDQVPLPNSSL